MILCVGDNKNSNVLLGDMDPGAAYSKKVWQNLVKLSMKTYWDQALYS